MRILSVLMADAIIFLISIAAVQKQNTPENDPAKIVADNSQL